MDHIEHRAEGVTTEEVLIDGTDYVPWEGLPKYAEDHVKALREARRELKDLHAALVELKPASGSTVPRVITAEQVEAAAKALWGRSPFAEVMVLSWEAWSKENLNAAETWRDEVRATLAAAGLLIEGQQ